MCWEVASSTKIHIRLILVVYLHVEGGLLLHVGDVLLVPDLDSILGCVDVK